MIGLVPPIHRAARLTGVSRMTIVLIMLAAIGAWYAALQIYWAVR